MSERGTTEVPFQPRHIENLEEIEVKLSAYWCSLLLSWK